MSHALQERIRAPRDQEPDRTTFVALPRLLLYTAWFALIAGLTEGIILGAERHLLHRIIYRSADSSWLPSAGAFILFSLVSIVVWLLGARFRSLRKPRAVVAVLSFLTLFSVFMIGRWVTALAAAALAIGITSLLIRSSRTPQLIDRAARRSIGPLVGVWLVLILIARAGPAILERRELARLPGARAGAPNIIFLILDTVRARSLSLYGYERSTTPNLARLARTGVTFERAIAPAPWTLPSHGSMFTGHQPFDLSITRFSALNDRYPTLAEVLAQRGYATAGFVANLAYGTREFGLARGFQHWNDYPLGLSQLLVNSSLGRWLLLERFAGDRNTWFLRVLGVDQWIGHTRSAADVNAHLVNWLERRPDRPFFVFANYFDAHMPYLPPKPYLGSYGPVRTRSLAQRLREEGPGKWPKRGLPAHERAMHNRYEESIAYLDMQVGLLVSELRRRGLLQNTILVIGSDHGEEFGENGHYEHDSGLGFAQTRVPLLIIAPGRVPAAARVQTPVGLRDLGPTLLQLSGNDPGALAGHSFVSSWSTSASPDDVVLSTLEKHEHSLTAIVTPRFHYIRTKQGDEQLYDHLVDPDEANDISHTPAGQAALPALRAILARETNGR